MPTLSSFFGISIRMYYDDHREELRADWERAASHEPMLPIPPLE